MTDPIVRFISWLDEAKQRKDIIEPTAMCLATANAKGQPSARMVLLKEADERGFVFYTNLESHKSEDIKQNQQAALCFHWMPLLKQVRVEGRAEPVGPQEANAYFASRPRESQIGAWASSQSHPLESRETLLTIIRQYEESFKDNPVPRPPFWSGWRIVPQKIEFWQHGEHRLHERELYTREERGWNAVRLYP